MTCADCGASVTPGATPGWWRDDSKVLWCRCTYDYIDPLEPRVVAADFHYVEGEVQRHLYVRLKR